MSTHAAIAARRMNLYAIVLILLGLIGYGLAWAEANRQPFKAELIADLKNLPIAFLAVAACDGGLVLINIPIVAGWI